MDDNNKGMLNEIAVINIEESPKIDPLITKDFKEVNLISNDNVSEDNEIKRAPTADLVNVIIEDTTRNSGVQIINKDENTQVALDNSLNKKIEDLLLIIKKNKNEIINNLYIISSKYDVLYYRYNNISLAILVLSTIITFVEAIRLTLVNYDTTYKDSKISTVISSETISLIINILSLSLSTILTVLSSIAKFKNYKENMDKLKNIHDELFSYKNMYDKQKQLILFFKTSNNMNEDIYKEIHQTIEGYNKEIKAISIFENIRNTDIIKFHKIKADQDVKLKKILEEREVKLLRINTLSKNKKENIGNEKPNCCTNLIPL